MGICGSKPPATKQDVTAAPAQNGSLDSKPPPLASSPQPATVPANSTSTSLSASAPQPAAQPTNDIAQTATELPMAVSV